MMSPGEQCDVCCRTAGGTFALRRKQFASSRQCKRSDAETDSVAEGEEEEKREREKYGPKGAKTQYNSDSVAERAPNSRKSWMPINMPGQTVAPSD